MPAPLRERAAFGSGHLAPVAHLGASAGSRDPGAEGEEVQTRLKFSGPLCRFFSWLVLWQAPSGHSYNELGRGLGKARQVIDEADLQRETGTDECAQPGLGALVLRPRAGSEGTSLADNIPEGF